MVDTQVTIADNGVQGFATVCAPDSPASNITVYFGSESLLDFFGSAGAEGSFTLQVEDAFPDFDDGTLYSWGISLSGLCGVPTAAPTQQPTQ